MAINVVLRYAKEILTSILDVPRMKHRNCGYEARGLVGRLSKSFMYCAIELAIDGVVRYMTEKLTAIFDVSRVTCQAILTADLNCVVFWLAVC